MHDIECYLLLQQITFNINKIHSNVMGKPNKKLKLLAWLNQIKNNNIKTVRKYMKIDDFFNLYIESTSDNSINQLGFFRIINRIEEEKQFKT